MYRHRNPTGFVRRRQDTKSVRWRGVVKYPDLESGQWLTRSATFDRRAEAQAWVDKALVEHRSNPAYKPPSEENFKDFLDRWVESVAASRTRDTTTKAYRRYVKPLLRTFGHKPLKALTPADFQAVYTQMLKDGKATSTIYHAHVVAHSALKQAVEWGLLPFNPTDRVKPPRVTTPEIVLPSPDELRRLLETAEQERLKALWWLIALTGCRKGEAVALKWTDINWDRHTVTIRRTAASDGGLLTIHDAKTVKGRRTVALSDYLTAILKEHQERQRIESDPYGSDWNPDQWVFPSRQGTMLWPGNVNRAFRSLRKRAGLPTTLRPHDLRHAMATAWLTADPPVPVKVVSERLGHANINITLQIYGHLLPNMQAESAQRLDAQFLRGGSGTNLAPRAEKNGEISATDALDEI